MIAINPYSQMHHRTGQIGKGLSYGLLGLALAVGAATLGRVRALSATHPKLLRNAQRLLVGGSVLSEVAAVISFAVGTTDRLRLKVQLREAMATDEEPDLDRIRALCQGLGPNGLAEPWGDASPSYRDDTPLMDAVYALARCRNNPGMPDFEERLHRREGVVKILLDAGAPPVLNTPDRQGPIEIAVLLLKEECLERVVGWMMDKGARFPTWGPNGVPILEMPGVELTESLRQIHDETLAEDMRLLEYARRGDHEAVRRLLAAGCYPEIVQVTGDDLALDLAIKAGHVEVVKALLESGHRIKWNDRPSALDVAVDLPSPNLEIVNLLLQEGASPLYRYDANRPSAFDRAVDADIDSELSQTLLEFIRTKHLERVTCPEVRCVTPTPATPAERSERSRMEEQYWELSDLCSPYLLCRPSLRQLQLDRIRELAQKLVPLFNDDANWIVSLFETDSTEVIRILLEAGADPRVKDGSGRTAVYVAVKLPNEEEKFRLLLEYGGRVPNKADEPFTSPYLEQLVYGQIITECLFLRDTKKGDIRAAKRYLDAGCDINVTYNSWTALMKACEAGQVDMVKFLLGNGADASLQNRDGQTASSVAATDEIRALLNPSD